MIEIKKKKLCKNYEIMRPRHDCIKNNIYTKNSTKYYDNKFHKQFFDFLYLNIKNLIFNLKN